MSLFYFDLNRRKKFVILGHIGFSGDRSWWCRVVYLYIFTRSSMCSFHLPSWHYTGYWPTGKRDFWDVNQTHTHNDNKFLMQKYDIQYIRNKKNLKLPQESIADLRGLWQECTEVISGMWRWNLALNYSSGCGVAGCQGCPMCSLRTVKTLFPWVIQELPIQSLQSWGNPLRGDNGPAWSIEHPRPHQSKALDVVKEGSRWEFWTPAVPVPVDGLSLCAGWEPACSPGGSSCRINQIIHRWDTCR